MKELDRFYNLPRLKKLDMNGVLKGLGGTECPGSRPHHKSRSWIFGGMKLVITGNVYFNNTTQVGGVNPINLVMELLGLSFYDACETLALLPFCGPFDEMEPTNKAGREYDAAKDREDACWPVVRGYLIGSRCLDVELIDSLHNSGAVYADTRGNCCFRVLGGAGVFKRGSVDPVPPKKAFKQKIGRGVFVINGDSTDCYIVESPIDAISLKMLRPSAWIVATGGNCAIESLQWILSGKEVFVATDADQAGERLAQKLLRCFGGKRVLPPQGKDWNEYIQTLNKPGEEGKYD